MIFFFCIEEVWKLATDDLAYVVVVTRPLIYEIMSLAQNLPPSLVCAQFSKALVLKLLVYLRVVFTWVFFSSLLF